MSRRQLREEGSRRSLFGWFFKFSLVTNNVGSSTLSLGNMSSEGGLTKEFREETLSTGSSTLELR